jgi:formylglycine-generating enzyme required for sulfatase activity/serine/threonine protein kinase
MSKTSCPNREELLAYLVGDVGDEVALQVASHVDTCVNCQDTLAHLDDGQDALLGLLRSPAEADEFAHESHLQAALARAEGLLANSASPPAAVAATPEVPRKLGDYELLEQLGAGGMGAVYKARHSGLDRLVALKILPPSRLQDEQATARFRREIRVLGQLRHPNLVLAYDARDVEGIQFVAMELVDGLSLAEITRRCGPLRFPDACELIRQAAVGLQYAHEHGLVHRDVKPSNLMLTTTPASSPAQGEDRGGVVKILDFGLALLAARRLGDEMTRNGQIMGTVDYMAPEQITDSHQVDTRADIYSLGCTLYSLLAGHPPFGGPEYQGIFAKQTAHVHTPPLSISQLRTDVPESLAGVIERMLAKSPGDRYATPGEVATAIAPFAVGCDLARLLAEPEAVLGLVENARVSAESRVSSALSGADAAEKEDAGRSGSWQAEPHASMTEARVSAEPVGSRQERDWARLIARAAESLRPAGIRPRTVLAIALGLVPLSLLLGVIIWYKNTRIEVPDGSTVEITEDGIKVQPPAPPARTGEPPALAIAPFDATQARKHQEAWAKYLGIPVEQTNSVGMKFTLIPPGEFDMGLADQEVVGLLAEAKSKGWAAAIEHLPHAAPTHREKIGKAFQLGIYEVTQAEYQRVMGHDPSKFQGPPTRPVEQVTWTDAMEFCRKLSELPLERKAGAVYRLPTEVEWEYACRAGMTTRYSFGEEDRLLDLYAWWAGNTARHQPVGRLRPNAWRLFDMHGNVWEWCADWFDPDNRAQEASDGPRGADSGPPRKRRAVRGGSWVDEVPVHFRSAFRTSAAEPDYRTHIVGFRVVRTPLEAQRSIDSTASTPSPLALAPDSGRGPTAEGPAPSLAVAPFDLAQAKEHQWAWAEHLGVRIEFENSIGMKFVLIPPGEFDMGSTQEEIAALLPSSSNQEAWVLDLIRSEGPRHRVRITRPFYLGKFEVTVGQFRHFVEARNYKTEAEMDGVGGNIHDPKKGEFVSKPDYTWRAPGVPQTQTDQHPVIQVSWNDAVQFCAWLREQDGRNCRLPTEAEWEYACRAGTTTYAPFANELVPQFANTLDRSYKREYGLPIGDTDWFDDGCPHTAPVGRLQANPFGLYDMLGNVTEWCVDSWAADYYRRSPRDDPRCPSDGSQQRTLRGGNWRSYSDNSRSAFRAGMPTHVRSDNMGFRVVLECAPNK